MPRKAVCPLCSGTGWKSQDRPDGSPAVVRCACQDAAPDAATVLRDIGVPVRIRDSARFDYFDEISQPLERAKAAVLKWADRFPDVRAGLVLTGPPGVGKTHLAVAALRHILVDRQIAARARFVSVPHLLRESQGAWKDAVIARKQILEQATNAEILLLDELGARTGELWQEQAQELLLYILTRCFQNGGFLICTTVYPFRATGEQKSLAEQISIRGVSLLREACRPVQIDGDDYRDTVLSHGTSV